MSPAESLAIWSQACKTAGVNWYLYKDALLCACGYHKFPDTLQNAQVAVFATDLENIITHVFPKLPRDWTLDIHNFVTTKNALCFKQDDTIVLDIHMLYALENQEQIAPFSASIRQIRANARTKTKLLNILNHALGQFWGKFITRICRNIDTKAFRALIALAKSNSQTSLFYCDHLTNREGVIISKDHFAEVEALICEDIVYPVFSGYLTYLADVYGDYENGLFDEIGCGLTVEDKLALKEHQAKCKEALAFVNNLSEEFGLQYYLLAGSVLGPVRHGGFIPWDDDIDIGVRIEDLAHFEALVKEHLPSRLPEGFKLMQSGANNPYPRMFSKICYDGRCCIDLWPLVPTYTDGFRAKLTWYFAKIITKVHYKKIGQKVTRFVKIVNLMSFFMSDKLVMWLARQNESKYKNKNTPAYINLYSIYRRNKETILREWLDEKATANFDGIAVPVVGCTEAYLTHLYGDYMSKPAPWKRASRHFARFYISGTSSADNFSRLEPPAR